MIGAWLFRHRGWLPVPLLAGMALTRWAAPAPPPLVLAGLAVIGAGEAVRVWAVGHIGLPSRTREDGAHRVVASGPYGLVRNPLYVGNILIFIGIGLLAWPSALIAGPALALHYHFIVAWEEWNLTTKLGAPYEAYCARVPRWIPRRPSRGEGRWDGREALRSERSTLLALAIILLVMGMMPGP